MTDMISPASAVNDHLPARQHAPAPGSTRARDTRTREGRAPGGIALRFMGTVFRGGSAWSTQPESLEQIWREHGAASRYYQGALWLQWLRGPRYVWGLADTAKQALLYGLGIATRTFPRCLLLAGLIISAHWWL